MWLRLLALAIVLATSGCGRESPSPATVPAKKAVDQAKVAELEQQIERLRKQRADLESLYERQVLARHPEWTPEEQKEQLAILRSKWEGGNRTSEDDTVHEMKWVGSRIWRSKLVDDDYRDMHRAKSAQWRIDDEIKAANQQLARVRQGGSK